MSEILLHVESGVMTLTFNRVDKKNAITLAMYDALTAALADAAVRADVRVLLLQGDATVFTAGNDLADFQQTPPTSAMVESAAGRFLMAIADFPKPLLAAVCGPAVGIGTTLLLHCDLVFAGDNAAFALPFVNLGLVPEAASSLLLPQLMGHHRAAEALLMGEPFLAEAALEVGLVNRVLPPTECHAYAQQQAQKLATKPARSLLETKRLIKAGQRVAVRACMKEEFALFAHMLQEPAAREALTAFSEHRKPDFSQL